MNMAFQPEPVPVWMDDRGDIRVRGTRILLDVLLDLHHQGWSAETIAAGYPDLTLADVYSVLAYYYRHKDEADRYLHEREEASRLLRQQIEATQPPIPGHLKEKLEALQARKG